MKFQVETWAYYLMPNHIHIIVVHETKGGKICPGVHIRLRPYLDILNICMQWKVVHFELSKGQE